MPKEKLQLTSNKKELMADQLANFFFEFWQNQDNNLETNQQKGNQAATLQSGFSSGGYPDNKVVA